MARSLLLIVCLFVYINTLSQSNNYWTRSFNEESSLLSGAVVGGGAGPSAIYYNPSSISEISESKLSFHASLFSIEFYDLRNALGADIDLNSTKGVIQPRFISYMIQPKKNKALNFEIAFLNNENYYIEMTKSVDKNIDILKSISGDERYFAVVQYLNNFRDDWFGVGGSWRINSNLSFGASMFLSVKSLEYRWDLGIEACPLTDSVFNNSNLVPFYSASYNDWEYVKYINYRLLLNFGLMYKKDNFSFGLSLKTPSLNVYSGGKRDGREEKHSNITSPYSNELLPNYVVADYREKNDVKVNSKSPVSVAAGFTCNIRDNSRTIFTTIEYFGKLSPYKIVEANENSNLISGSVFKDIESNEWLTFVHGAKPILNAAVGYRWNVNKNLMIMTGFRTDFNYIKNYNYGDYDVLNSMKGLNLDFYHITGGLNITVFGQDLITGFQYSFGHQTNQQEFANLSDPVEYSTLEQAALQGTRQNNVNLLYNAISLYFGATINFGKKTDN